MRTLKRGDMHYITIEDANTYGLNEAILISYLTLKIQYNINNKKYQHDGRVWTYGSVTEIKESLPYLSVYQIRLALKHLEEEGVIMTGNYNRYKYDKTKWYAFVNEEKFIYKMG